MIPANPSAYLHDADRVALNELKKIPLFDKICSKFVSAIQGGQLEILNMSSKIRLSEEQVPRVYNMLPGICEKLGIAVPPLYLELNRNPNAYTYGHKDPFITVTSGLLECLNDEEIYAVLAHECGHIACEHVLYHTMGNLILTGGLTISEILGNNLVTFAVSQTLETAFYYWMKCSEFSADRAAGICCENSKPVVQTMMRLAGGTSHIGDEINVDLFVNQAAEYSEKRSLSTSNKIMEFFATRTLSHPLLSVRAHEAILWCESDAYKDILSVMHGDAPETLSTAILTGEDVMFCHSCGKPIANTSIFCPICGKKQKKDNKEEQKKDKPKKSKGRKKNIPEQNPESEISIDSDDNPVSKEEKICTECGTVLSEKAVFCRTCGAKYE